MSNYLTPEKQPQPVAQAQQENRNEQYDVTLLDWFRWRWNRSAIIRPSLHIATGIMSVVCVMMYIINTYRNISPVVDNTYFIASWMFLVEYMVGFAVSTHKFRYVLQLQSCVDLATIIVGWVNFWDKNHFLESVAFIRVLRMLFVLRFFGSLSQLVAMWLSGWLLVPSQMQLYKQFTQLFLTLFSVIFIGGCAFYEIEGNLEDYGGSPQYLHQGFYWACVTITTIGYGDYYPSTVLGQVLFPAMIAIILVVVPNQVSKVTSALGDVNRYMRRVYRSWATGHHIVLMGHITVLNTTAIIDELYASDRGAQTLDLVILANCKPGPDMTMHLATSQAADNVRYLQGTPFSTQDLDRADVTRSKAIVVLCNKHATDPVDDDSNTLMTVLALVQYLAQRRSMSPVQWAQHIKASVVGGQGLEHAMLPDGDAMPLDDYDVPRIIAQFHLPETIYRARHLLFPEHRTYMLPAMMSGLEADPAAFQPLCWSALQHSLMGASLATPGVVTLLSNMVTSIDTSDANQIWNEKWIQEYLEGAGKELYEVVFPEEFRGRTYQEAAASVFEHAGTILLALRDTGGGAAETGMATQRGMLLAPASNTSFKIDPDVTTGLMLADHRDQAVQALKMLGIKTRDDIPPLPPYGPGGSKTFRASTMVRAYPRSATFATASTFRRKASPQNSPFRVASYQAPPFAAPETTINRRRAVSPAGDYKGMKGDVINSRSQIMQDDDVMTRSAQIAVQDGHVTGPSSEVMNGVAADVTRTSSERTASARHADASSPSLHIDPGAGHQGKSIGWPSLATVPEHNNNNDHVHQQQQQPLPAGLAMVGPEPHEPCLKQRARSDDVDDGDVKAATVQDCTSESGNKLHASDPIPQEHTIKGTHGHDTPPAAVEHLPNVHGDLLHQPAHHSLQKTADAQHIDTPSAPPQTLLQRNASDHVRTSHPARREGRPDVHQSHTGPVHRYLETFSTSRTSASHVHEQHVPLLGHANANLRSLSVPATEGGKASAKLHSRISRASASHLKHSSRAIQAHLEQKTAAEPLDRVETLDHALEVQPQDLVIITGDSCFEHLDEMLSSMKLLSHTTHPSDSTRSDDGMMHQQLRSQMSQPNTTRSGEGGAEEGATLLGMSRQRYRDVLRSKVVIMDPVGPSQAQVPRAKAADLVVLQRDPVELSNMDALKLPLNWKGKVRALVLPRLASRSEGAASGEVACSADAQTLRVCSNLRAYCTSRNVQLEIWAEAVLSLNVPYILPLCYIPGTSMPNNPTNAWHHAPSAQSDVDNVNRGSNPSRYTSPIARFGVFQNDRISPAVPTERTTPDISPNKQYSSAFISPQKSMTPGRQSSVRAPSEAKTVSMSQTCLQGLSDTVRALLPAIAFTGRLERRLNKMMSATATVSPMFSGGNIFSNSFLDKVVGQVVFNPSLIDMYHLLSGSWIHEEMNGSQEEMNGSHDLDSRASVRLTDRLLASSALPSNDHHHGNVSDKQQHDMMVEDGESQRCQSPMPADAQTCGTAEVVHIDARAGSQVNSVEHGSVAVTIASEQSHPADQQQECRPGVEDVSGQQEQGRSNAQITLQQPGQLPADEHEPHASRVTAVGHYCRAEFSPRLLLLSIDDLFHVLTTAAAAASYSHHTTGLDVEPAAAGVNDISLLGQQQQAYTSSIQVGREDTTFKRGSLEVYKGCRLIDLRKWEHVYLFCLQHGALAVGMYRRSIDTGHPYVYTAPPKDTVIRETDQVYIIATHAILPYIT